MRQSRIFHLVLFFIIMVSFSACNNDKENKAPDTPSNASPADKATGISPTQLTLTWSCSDPDNDKLTYDVYFGTNPNPKIAKSKHTGTSYDVGNINEATTYYWKIVAQDDAHETISPVWSFTTAGGGTPGSDKITYLQPANNATNIGSSVNLSWTTSITNPFKYDIYLGTNSNPQLIKGNYTEQNITITDLLPNTKYYWKIVASTNNSDKIEGGIWNFTTAAEEEVKCVDFEGNEYRTVKIGNQIWMAENLRSKKYADGTNIPHYYAYDDSPETVDSVGYYYKVADVLRGSLPSSSNPSNVQGIAPNGWHVPSMAEWEELFNCVGGASIAGVKLKSSSPYAWEEPYIGTDDYGMGIRGVGLGRDVSGITWRGFGEEACFHTTTINDNYPDKFSAPYFDYDDVSSAVTEVFVCRPVRCVKNK